MRGIQFIPADTQIPFMRFHKIFLGASAFVVVASILLVLLDGLNFGIDFRGGILLDVKTQGSADVGAMRQTLSGLDLGEVGIQEFGSPDNVLIRLQRQEGGEAEQTAAINRVKEALGGDVEYRRIELVGPQVSAELFRDALYALGAALLSIAVYLWFRFEWQFGLAGVLSLLHDCIAIVGVFALLGYEFNLTIVAAILTIAGYSINDTVVIYDRVRESMRKYRTMPFRDLINLALNETLSRTILTVSTVALAVLALLFFGGEVLRGFSIAMLWGIVIGTYSSLFIAAPLLYYIRPKRAAVAKDAAGAPAPSRTS
jgi:preprotein translocase subunit SecF